MHRFVVGAIFLNHHSIRLLDDHPGVFDRLIIGVVRNKAVGSVGRPAGGWNGAGVDVGIDDRLIMLLVVLVITCEWNQMLELFCRIPCELQHRPKEKNKNKTIS